MLVVAGLQAVIGNYAVPILEDKQVWGTNDDSRTAYMDTQVSAQRHSAAQQQQQRRCQVQRSGVQVVQQL